MSDSNLYKFQRRFIVISVQLKDRDRKVVLERVFHVALGRQSKTGHTEVHF